tara:strand:- start:66 stop:245 length:180 start_codon:yes stop_codon:yes gene_type:complete
MNASKKENVNNTLVEEKKVVKKDVKTVQNEAVVELLDKRFEKLAELELRLKKVEERMGL